MKTHSLNITLGLMINRELLEGPSISVKAVVRVDEADLVALKYGERLAILDVLRRVYKGKDGKSVLASLDTLMTESLKDLVVSARALGKEIPPTYEAQVVVLNVEVLDTSKDRLVGLRRWLAADGDRRFGEDTIFAALNTARGRNVPFLVQYVWLTQLLSAEHRANILASIFADGADGVQLCPDLARSIERLGYDWPPSCKEGDDSLRFRQTAVNYAMFHYVTQPQTRYSMFIVLLLGWGHFGREKPMRDLMDTYISEDWESLDTAESFSQPVVWDNNTHAVFRALLIEGFGEVSSINKHNTSHDMLLLRNAVYRYGNPDMEKAMDVFFSKPNPFFPTHTSF
jgi:hypothetical protein